MASSYNDLNQQRNNAYWKKYQAEKRISENQRLLDERLYPAKASLAEQHERCISLEDSHKQIEKEDFEWKGQTFIDFESKLDEIKNKNEDYRKRHLDEARDALNDEITRIENLIYSDRGIIYQMWGVINSIGNEIENLFNEWG